MTGERDLAMREDRHQETHILGYYQILLCGKGLRPRQQ